MDLGLLLEEGLLSWKHILPCQKIGGRTTTGQQGGHGCESSGNTKDHQTDQLAIDLHIDAPE